MEINEKDHNASSMFGKTKTVFTRYETYIYPLLAAAAIFIISNATSHFLNTFRIGYLQSFGITSNLPITNSVFHSQFLTFISLIACTAIPFLGNFVLNKCVRTALKKIKISKIQWGIIVLIFSFFISFISVFIFWMYVNLGLSNFSLSDVFYNFFNMYTICLALVIGLSSAIFNISAFFESIKKKSDKADSCKNDIDSHKTVLSDSFKICSCLLVFLIFSMCFIYLTDAMFASAGNMTAKSEKTYPMFAEKGIKYIVIAAMPDNQYLVIQEDTLLTKEKTIRLTNKTKYRIRNINELALGDMDNPLLKISAND